MVSAAIRRFVRAAACVAWLVPLAAMVFFGYILRNYFLR